MDEYHRIVIELSIFCLGLGMITVMFALLLHLVMFDPTGNIEWQNVAIIVLYVTATVLVATGGALLTKSRGSVIACVVVGFGGAVACVPLTLISIKGTNSGAGCGLLLPAVVMLLLGLRSSMALSKFSLAHMSR